MFNKMIKKNDSLYIQYKKDFDANNHINLEYIKRVFDFAYEMTFGASGQHRNHRSGGTHQRRNGEIFCDTFQGKISEFAIFQFFKDNLSISEPDLQTYGLGKWDTFDFSINGKVISVKSTKHYGNLLLLETKDWNLQGQYIPNYNENIDYVILVRIKDEVTNLLKANKLYYSDKIDKELLWNLLKDISCAFDIPGYITGEDLIYLINNRFVIRRGERLNASTVMDAENYYCQAGDMHNIEKLMEEIK